jgi:hypothetical protein
MDTSFLAATTTRRSCLKGSALVGLYVWAISGSVRAMTAALSELPVNAIVIDAGVPGVADFASGSKFGVARIEMFGDDLAELFYGRLVPVWRSYGVRGLAGLTRAPALFLLESLAADYGLRTVGLERAHPAAGWAGATSRLERLSQERSGRRLLCSTRAEPMRDALLDQDDTVFAWWMAPVHRPIHCGITVISP